MKPRTSGILVPEYNDWGTRTGLIYSQEYGLKVGDIISMDVNGDRVLYRVNGQVVGSAGMVLDLQSIDDHANHVLTFG